MTKKKLNKLNQLFGREVGRGPSGEPIFKWAFLPDLFHQRYRTGKDDWDKNAAGIWTPKPAFEKVQTFARLGPRWAICKWQMPDAREWEKMFGSRAVLPAQGFYFPTDVICKEGWEPTEDWTNYWIGQIKLTMSKSAVEYEAHIEAEMEREDEYKFNTIYDAVMDTCTAYGNKPGCRSGGVSFPAV